MQIYSTLDLKMCSLLEGLQVNNKVRKNNEQRKI